MSKINVNTIANASDTSELTIDSNGDLSITGKMTQPINPIFIAIATGSGWTSITTGADYSIPFNETRVNRGNNFNTSTYAWTAPIDCVMMFGSSRPYMDSNSANYTQELNYMKMVQLSSMNLSPPLQK